MVIRNVNAYVAVRTLDSVEYVFHVSELRFGPETVVKPNYQYPGRAG